MVPIADTPSGRDCEHRLGALPDRLRSRAGGGDGLQRGGIVDPLERVERGVERGIPERDAAQGGDVADAVECGATDRGIRGIPDDVAQGAVTGDAVERGAADALVRGSARDRDQRLRVGEARERRLALGDGTGAAGRLDEDLLDSLDREIAQPAIGLARGDPLEESDVAELPDRDPPNLRVRIRARDRRETVLLLGAHLAHRRRPHRGIGMTPPGPKSRDQIHGSCRPSSLPTPTWPCLWTIVLRDFWGVGYVK